jgi:hypothetical protein
MRTTAFALAFTLVVTLGATFPVMASEDSGSISRDARGSQPVREHDPLGGPVTPRLYALGQTTIFVAGVTLLVVAALLGAYTLVSARPNP